MTDAEALLARATRQHRSVSQESDHASAKALELAGIYERAARRTAQADLFGKAA